MSISILSLQIVVVDQANVNSLDLIIQATSGTFPRNFLPSGKTSAFVSSVFPLVSFSIDNVPVLSLLHLHPLYCT